MVHPAIRNRYLGAHPCTLKHEAFEISEDQKLVGIIQLHLAQTSCINIDVLFVAPRYPGRKSNRIESWNHHVLIIYSWDIYLTRQSLVSKKTPCPILLAYNSFWVVRSSYYVCNFVSWWSKYPNHSLGSGPSVGARKYVARLWDCTFLRPS